MCPFSRWWKRNGFIALLIGGYVIIVFVLLFAVCLFVLLFAVCLREGEGSRQDKIDRATNQIVKVLELRTVINGDEQGRAEVKEIVVYYDLEQEHTWYLGNGINKVKEEDIDKILLLHIIRITDEPGILGEIVDKENVHEHWRREPWTTKPDK